MSIETQSFNVSHAIALGSPDLAIIVNFFVNCISLHKRLGRNAHDGRTWNYCSRRELAAYFPYWNEEKIRRFMEKLLSLGVMIQGNYNKKACDRTLWYAFANQGEWISEPEKNAPTVNVAHLANLPNPFGKFAKPIPLTTTNYLPPTPCSPPTPQISKASTALTRRCNESRPSPMGEEQQSMPFTEVDLLSAEPAIQERTETPLKSSYPDRATLRSLGVKYPLKSHQMPYFDAILDLDPLADIVAAHVVIRANEKIAGGMKKILDAIYHTAREISRGVQISNPFAFVRKILTGTVAPVTAEADRNRALAEQWLRDNCGHSLRIDEKFVVCTITQHEVRLAQPRDAFLRGLEAACAISRRYDSDGDDGDCGTLHEMMEAAYCF